MLKRLKFGLNMAATITAIVGAVGAVGYGLVKFIQYLSEMDPLSGYWEFLLTCCAFLFVTIFAVGSITGENK